MIHFWRRLPEFRGKKRIIRFLHKRSIRKLKTISFQLNNGIQFTVPNLEETIAFDLFFEGHYEASLIKYLVEKLPLNGTFIDVGANIGAISVFLAKLRPDIKIFAFEASPFVSSYLNRNIEQNNLTNIFAVNNAVHSTDNIELDFFSPEDKFGKGSFSAVFTNKPEKASTIRLDRFFQENDITPDFIKVDVEGYEAMIFESLGQYLTTSANRPILIFEFVDWAESLSKSFKPGDAQKFILKSNYTLLDFNEWVAGKTVEIKEPQVSGWCEIIAFPVYPTR